MNRLSQYATSSDECVLRFEPLEPVGVCGDVRADVAHNSRKDEIPVVNANLFTQMKIRIAQYDDADSALRNIPDDTLDHVARCEYFAVFIVATFGHVPFVFSSLDGDSVFGHNDSFACQEWMLPVVPSARIARLAKKS